MAMKNMAVCGISICVGWRDFASFYADMGVRPSRDLSLDRIDVNRGYDCGKCDDCKARGAVMNCRWATLREQSLNKRTTIRLTIRGETMTLLEWCERFEIDYDRVWDRIKCGWDQEDAVTTPIRPQGVSDNPEFNAWKTARQRCYNPNNPKHKDYGGRGIAMCERWRVSFKAFLADMGPRPSSKHSL